MDFTTNERKITTGNNVYKKIGETLVKSRIFARIELCV